MAKRKAKLSSSLDEASAVEVKTKRQNSVTAKLPELPSEILVRCWKDLEERKNVRLVCRRWCEICKKNYPTVMPVGGALEIILTRSKWGKEEPAVLIRQATIDDQDTLTYEKCPLIVELSRLDDFLDGIVMSPAVYGEMKTVLALSFGNGSSAKNINQILNTISQCHLAPNRLFIDGKLKGAIQLMATARQLYDKGKLEEIRFVKIQLDTRLTKKPVIDDRILLQNISRLYVEPIGGDFCISSAAFNAMINAENLAQNIYLEKCKGIDAEFVKSAVEAWKVAARDRISMKTNGDSMGFDDSDDEDCYAAWQFPLQYEGDRTSAIKQLHRLLEQDNEDCEYRIGVGLRHCKRVEQFYFFIDWQDLFVDVMFDAVEGDKEAPFKRKSNIILKSKDKKE